MIALGAGCLFDFDLLFIYKLVFGSSLCILVLGFRNKKQRRLKSGQIISMTVSKDKETDVF